MEVLTKIEKSIYRNKIGGYMCGICGVFDMNSQKRGELSTIERMLRKLEHRGPDNSDYFIRDSISLGFSRLSIVDLESGMQPIFNEDKSIVLICNGEIFNYIELRQKLVLEGHQFKTNSDVEVILHLYEEYEIDSFINELNGQFAFAIYDFNKNQLLCARDHVGIAPFFYTVADGLFIFASEIKAIIEHPAVERAVDLVGLDQIFTFPGIASPRTLFRDIKSLSNGCYIVVRGNNVEVREYWDLIYPEAGEASYVANEDYYIEKLDELLTESVKLRLQADVPVGFYLSGGLDSSLIATKIKQIDGSLNRHSFSIDFPDKSISESAFQRVIANKVNSIHHEKMFYHYEIVNRLKKSVYHSECALKETYNTASMALSESVRANNIKVVLTGEGADELFGGYVGYRFDKLRMQQKSQDNQGNLFENEVRRKIWGDENFLYEKEYYSYQNTKQELYSREIQEIFESVNCLNYPIINKERINRRDIFHKRSYVDFKLRMSDHLLSDHGDRMMYANSVEARYPFLDKNLIEFAINIPVDFKLRGFDEKYILKRVAKSLVPDEIIKRPKFAFVAPGSSELLKQDIEFIEDLLSYETIKRQGYFNPDVVQALRKKYKEQGFKLNVPYDSDLLIIVITFGIFIQQFQMPSIR